MLGVEVTDLVFLGLPKPHKLNNAVVYTWSPKDYRNRSWLLNLSDDWQVNSFNEQFLRLYSRLMLCGRSWVRKCGNEPVGNNCICSGLRMCVTARSIRTSFGAGSACACGVFPRGAMHKYNTGPWKRALFLQLIYIYMCISQWDVDWWT